MADLLSIRAVTKGYARGEEWLPVFANVSLEVLPGEIVAIIGGRLSGKTTLLRIASGMECPREGSVLLEGEVLSDVLDLPRVVRWVDRVGPGLKMGVLEFVGWPVAVEGRGRRSAEQEALRMLERVGAQECLDLCWEDLSNWQRVLVGLARGFIGEPKLVVMDDLLDALKEPTTEEASDLLRSLVEESRPRCGVLMAVSDMESAMFADRVLSITGKLSLKALSGRLTDCGEVVPLRSDVRTDGA